MPEHTYPHDLPSTPMKPFVLTSIPEFAFSDYKDGQSKRRERRKRERDKK
jgi:hypothetical protein